MGPKEKSYVQVMNGIDKNRNLVFAGISVNWVLKRVWKLFLVDKCQ
jgi:hypothetical protein